MTLSITTRSIEIYSKMALSDINFNSKDFEWSRAPLASMEDLSVVNTPIPTPTAGQSPKTKSRWSHRYSQMSLDNMLGPINEMGEDETEVNDGKNSAEMNNDQSNYRNVPDSAVKSTDSLTNHDFTSLSVNLKSDLETDKKHKLIGNVIEGREYNSILKNGNASDAEKLQPFLPSKFGDNQNETFHSDANHYNTERQSKIEDTTIPDSHHVINELIDTKNSHISNIPEDSTRTENTSEDPLGHIQWPKSAYQSEANYSMSMSPYPSLLPSAQPQHRHHDPQVNYRRMNVSSPRWRTCDVIPEEENMQIFTASQYEDKFLNHNTGYVKETDNLLLRPRQVQFISPKHKRKSLRQYQMVGASENNPVYSPGVVRSQRAFVQPKQVSSEMASLIRANDGSIDGAKSHIEPKDR